MICQTQEPPKENKSRGGWGVVNTGYCSIHPSSDDRPLPFARLWSEKDIASHVPMVEAVHEHDALAGIEFFMVVPTQQTDTLECRPFHPLEYNKK